METITKKYKNITGVCGHFAEGKNFLDGQTIKTNTLIRELESKYGVDNVLMADTHNWKRSPFKLFKQCMFMFKKCRNVIMLPGQNGLKIFVPVFNALNKIYNRKIHYVVIGGWLPEFLAGQPSLLNSLKKFDGIYVETLSMKKKLEELGLNNIYLMANFKQLNIISETEIPKFEKTPLKLCTFSRVIKEKGIEDAIYSVIKANAELENEVYKLDIYGQIDENYKKDFEEILSNTPAFINYKGIVPYDKTVEVLKHYYLLLFPTYYKGEGFAGTLLDSYASGLPVIVTDWRYNAEIVNEYETGRIIPIKDQPALTEILKNYAYKPKELLEMRRNCIEKAHLFTPSIALKDFFEKLEA